MTARTAAALARSASSHSPHATRASIRLATSGLVSTPYGRSTSSAIPASRADSRGRPSIISTSVRFDVGAMEPDGLGVLLGELQGEPELREALVGAAQVGQVHAEHGERAHLGRPAPTARAIASAGRQIASDSS